MLKKTLLLSTLTLILLARQAVALTDEIPNKPGSDAETYVRTPYTLNDMGYFRTQDVYPDPKGELNVIVSPEYDQSDDAGDFSLPLSLEYGITDHWLASIAFEIYRGHYPDSGSDAHGTGDIDIFTKYSFLYINDSFTSAALTFNLHIPTGDIDRGLTDGFLRFEPSVLVAHDFPMRHWVNQVFGEWGIRFVDRIKNHPDPDDDDPAAHIFVFNAGYVLRTARVNYLAEINWRKRME